MSTKPLWAIAVCMFAACSGADSNETARRAQRPIRAASDNGTAPAPKAVDESPDAPVRAKVQIVDCQAKGKAPWWCSEFSYATESERTGTLAVVVRSDSEGVVHYCSRGANRDGDLFYVYSGPASSMLDEQTLQELDARVVTLVPREDPNTLKPNTIYFVLPPGATTPNTLGPCPITP